MRWSPIILDLVFTVAVWTLLLWLLRVQRARMGDVPSSERSRATTCAPQRRSLPPSVSPASTWLITDATGPHWLHRLSLPATTIFLASGAILAGYAGWLSGP